MAHVPLVPLVDDLDHPEELTHRDLRSLVDGQALIVECIALNAPLDQTLLMVANTIEAMWPHSKAAFVMSIEETDSAATTAPTLTTELRQALNAARSSVVLGQLDRANPFSPVLIGAKSGGGSWPELAEALAQNGFGAAWLSLVTPLDDPTPSWMAVFVPRIEPLTPAERSLLSRFAHLSRVAIDQQRRELELHRLIADERQRIAGVIHDDPIQALTAVSLRIQRLSRYVEGNAAEQLADIHVAVGSAIERMRRLLVDLHPPTLDDEGLVSAIDQYLGEVVEPHGVTCTLRDSVDEEPAIGTASLAYRLAVEALWNVVKHAEATQVEVDVTIEAGTVQIRISDDGIGFDKSKAERRRAGHLGISASRELAARASGTWHVDTAPGEGTVVSLWLPGAAPIDATE